MSKSQQKIDEAEFLKLHAAGLMDIEIAQHFDVRKASVQEFRNRRNLLPNAKQSKPAPVPVPAPNSDSAMDRAGRIRLIRAVWDSGNWKKRIPSTT